MNAGFKSPELVVNLPMGDFNTVEHDYDREENFDTKPSVQNRSPRALPNTKMRYASLDD